MTLPKITPEAAQAILALVSQATGRKLDGVASSAFQSVVAGIGDLMDDRAKTQLRSHLTAARDEVQTAHDDFRKAARGQG